MKAFPNAERKRMEKYKPSNKLRAEQVLGARGGRQRATEEACEKTCKDKQKPWLLEPRTITPDGVPRIGPMWNTGQQRRG